MKALVLVEVRNNKLASESFAAITAAGVAHSELEILIAHPNAKEIAKQLEVVSKVKVVMCAVADHYEYNLAEDFVSVLQTAVESGQYNAVFAPATTFGKDVMPRFAALSDVQQISEVIEVLGTNEYKRPIYAGNLIQKVKSTQAMQVVTVRGSSFDKPEQEAGKSCEIKEIDSSEPSQTSSYVSEEQAEQERPELTSADIVVSGGRGLGSSENFKIIEALADKLNAAMGASRAAVDSGFVANDLQVGQTGKIVAPKLYIAVGISGAIQHLAGMKDSKVIVAINKDAEAPIFQVADYGLVADLFEAVPELTEKL